MQRVAPAAAAMLALLVGACGHLPREDSGPGATSAPWPADVPPRIELTRTPFFPQDDHQCGPAALATALGASGISVQPAELVGEVYVPARKGSLQAEMLATTRRRGRIAYRIEPTFDALARAVAGGEPVVVLLNLGVRSWPIWHYAVVIGYEREGEKILLRSGRTERARLSWRRFRGAWSRAGNWGFIALTPGTVPAGATAAAYAAAVADFERDDRPGALRAYAAGSARWPDEPLLRLGTANVLSAQGDRAGAEQALRDLLARRPADAAARNNLAELLSQRGCRDAALAQIAIAKSHARATPLAPLIEATAREIDARPADPAASCP
ncbi:MAG: hypothetical protein CMLOHMNK_01987 [Steroidobacteraceae bacterium]|nr:hypothetical protein [Steroidobacteraceae bacterium]